MSCMVTIGAGIVEGRKVMITFYNKSPGTTILGLSKFILNEDREPIDDIILGIRWSTAKNEIMMDDGFCYCLTKYDPASRQIISYRIFCIDGEERDVAI